MPPGGLALSGGARVPGRGPSFADGPAGGPVVRPPPGWRRVVGMLVACGVAAPTVTDGAKTEDHPEHICARLVIPNQTHIGEHHCRCGISFTVCPRGLSRGQSLWSNRRI